MAVHFDFIMSDPDAENLMRIIYDYECDMMDQSHQYADKGSISNAKACAGLSKYAADLRIAMKNERVKETS